MGVLQSLSNIFSPSTRRAARDRVDAYMAKGITYPSNIIYLSDSLREASLSEINAQIELGAKKNAVVSICRDRLCGAFVEPPLVLFDQDDTALYGHPISLQLRSPHKQMPVSFFNRLVMEWGTLGGNTYIYKVRSVTGKVIGLIPFHDGHIEGVAAKSYQNGYVEKYRYIFGGAREDVDVNDIIPWRWGEVDPEKPWRGLSPMEALSVEIGAENEATRYRHDILSNDAFPRTVLTQDIDGDALDEKEIEESEAKFVAHYGGPNRGGVKILPPGMSIERLSANLADFVSDAMLEVPEARIAAKYRVPAMYAGLNVGLKHTTYSNVAEARDSFYVDTMVPLWISVGDAISEGLREDFKELQDGYYIAYDLNRVKALARINSETNAKKAVEAYREGLLTHRESRALLGYDGGEDAYKSSPVAMSIVGVPATEEKGLLLSATTPTLKHSQTGQPIVKANWFSSKEAKDAYWKQFDEASQGMVEEVSVLIGGVWEEKLAPMLKEIEAIVEAEEKGVQKKEDAFGQILKALQKLNPKEINALLESTTSEALRAFILQQMETAYIQVANDWTSVQSSFEKNIQKVLDDSLSQIKTAGEYKERLIKAVKEAGSGASVAKLTKIVQNSASTYTKSGAENIAQTTATLATNAAQDEAWSRFSGVQQILTRRDAKVRSKPGSSHTMWEGLIKVAGNYTDPNTGSNFKHPGDPSLAVRLIARCRCIQIFTPESSS